MLTYVFSKDGSLDSIFYDENYVPEELKEKATTIQREEVYRAEEREGFYAEIFLEEGEIKHRYIEIQKSDIEKENERLKEQLQKQSEEITQNQMAIVQIYELLSGGTGGTESESHS